MSIGKFLTYLLSYIDFLLGFVAGSISTALISMMINKHKIYLEAKRKHYEEIREEINRFARLVNSFGIFSGEILCRDPKFGMDYYDPKAILIRIERDAARFLEHYPRIKKKLLNVIELAKTHNTEIKQLKRNIEAFIKEQAKKGGRIIRYLQLDGVVSLILFDLLDYQGFLSQRIEKRDYSIEANNILKIGAFEIAKLPNDNIRQEIVDKVYSLLASLYESVKTKYSDMVTTNLEKAEEIISKIKEISRDLTNILKRYKTTGKYDGKCSECPKLIRYLIPPW